MPNDGLANTFVTDDGQIIFCNAWELSKKDLDEIAVMEATVDAIERRYKTKDIKTMMLSGISKRLLKLYIDAKRDLLVLYGID